MPLCVSNFKKYIPRISNRICCNKALWFLPTFLLLTLLAVYVPWVPVMPSGGLDPSWILTLNYATDHGFIFGRDVVFTYGPLHYLRTGIFNPASNGKLLVFDSLIAVELWLGIFALTRPRRDGWMLLFSLTLATAAGNEILFLLLPLTFSLLSAKALFDRGDAFDLAVGAALLMGMSLLSLVKGTMLIWAAFASVSVFMCALWLRRWEWAALSIVVPSVATPLLWLYAGQPLFAFPDYVASLWQISYGYNQAMCAHGDVKESILMLMMGGATLFWLWKRSELGRLHRASLVLAFAVYWFFAIKLSVVRHDGHAVFGGHFALLVPPLLGMISSGRRLGRVTIFGVLVCLIIDVHYAQNLVFDLSQPYIQAVRGIRDRVFDPNGLTERHQQALRGLAASAALPQVKGRVDLYPNDCSRIIATGLDWSPRPVFQSYSSYTPALAELNRKHLLGPMAPETIFFNVAAIDHRYPTLEDGASWPTLLALYKPEGFAGDYAILKRDHRASADDALSPLCEVDGRINEDIRVPQSSDPVFVTIDMRPTLAGRMANLAYKYNQIKLQVELENGSHKKYEIIPIMAQTGFVISPLVRDAHAYAALYGPGPTSAGLRVRSLRIKLEPLFRWQWSPEVHLRFSAVHPNKKS